MDEAKQFINSGYLFYRNLVNKDLCKKLHNAIAKNRRVSKNIFLSRKDYFSKQKKNKEFLYKSNILDNFNLDFVFKNKLFLKKVKLILGKDFEVYAKRIICGIPHKFFPTWISHKMELDENNMGPFIKQKYRDIRYFHGIDFHQDFIDFLLERGNFITVYVYLSKVTKEMSPLNVIPGTHLGGPSIFPHNLNQNKGKIIYKADGGKVINSKNKMLIGDAGDVGMWHSCLLHGTQINTASIPRFSLRLILRQKKNYNNSLMNRVNKKIKNIVSFEKMFDHSRYKTLGIKKKNTYRLKLTS
tara:strand:- start:134 stop:1030 length:897 start_codon:yes stop_codon:yes gene_type:complete